MNGLVDWPEVLKDARHVVEHVEEGRKLLQSLEIGSAVLAASAEWPHIREEWEGLLAALGELVSDFR